MIALLFLGGHSHPEKTSRMRETIVLGTANHRAGQIFSKYSLLFLIVLRIITLT